eukprot:9141894-Pyramimonas_sp.AAC.1
MDESSMNSKVYESCPFCMEIYRQQCRDQVRPGRHGHDQMQLARAQDTSSEAGYNHASTKSGLAL